MNNFNSKQKEKAKETNHKPKVATKTAEYVRYDVTGLGIFHSVASSLLWEIHTERIAYVRSSGILYVNIVETLDVIVCDE